MRVMSIGRLTFVPLAVCVCLFSSVSVFAQAGIPSEFSLERTQEDGTEVYLHDDGRTYMLRYSDGRLERQYLDGSPHIVTYPDGKTVYYNQDGAVIGESFADGRDVHYNEEGEITEEIRRTDTVTEVTQFRDGEAVSVQRERVAGEASEQARGVGASVYEKGERRFLFDPSVGLSVVLSQSNTVLEFQQEHKGFQYTVTVDPATGERVVAYTKDATKRYVRGMRNGEQLAVGSWFTGILYALKRRFATPKSIHPEEVLVRYKELLVENTSS